MLAICCQSIDAEKVSVKITRMQINASFVHQYYQPQRCDFRPFLVTKGESQEEPGPYEQVLFRLGQRHETEYLARLGEYLDLQGGDLVDRANRTLTAISQGHRVLYQPVFIQKATLAGQDVEIVGVPDFLVRDGTGYLIQDAKLSLHADEQSHPEILRQVELYGWLYEQAVGRPPVALQAVLGNSSIVDIPYDGGHRALDLLVHLIQLSLSSSEPYSPVGWSKCIGCGFRQRCWSAAMQSKDVAIVYGIDQGLAIALRKQGISTIDDLLAQFTPPTLATFRRPHGNKLRKVGSAASKILLHAQAMADNKEIRQSDPVLPTGENFVMFDLEGLPPELDELDKVYLWGTQVFGAKPGSYQAAVSDFGADGDRQGWQRFLDQAQAIFDAYGDVPFIHWHHYETTKLKAYVDRYGDPNGTAERVRENCVDLLPITRDAIVLPEPSYSLKVVERRVGYQRQLEEYGGDWSMAKYIEAVETQDTDLRNQIMQQILDYNREDLEATWAVFTWLRGLARNAGT